MIPNIKKFKFERFEDVIKLPKFELKKRKEKESLV